MHVKLISTCLVVTFSGFAHASADAYEWLDRMNSSVRTLDYEGHFVYQTGHQLGSMYLVHRVNNGVELERLVSLNGEPRQVIRGGKAVACLEPGKQAIQVTDNSMNRTTLAPQGVVNHKALAEQYSLHLKGQKRVAGRLARLVEITPKDNLRFGYQLYLDQKTALPLRTVTLDTEGNQRSQLLFVDLKTGDNITPIEYDLSALKYTEPSQKPLFIEPTQQMPDKKASAWRFTSKPEGYTMRSYRHSAANKLDHFVFSDGLASVSIYIEPLNGEALEGFSQMGAVQALGTHRGHYQITAVGEVPKSTLRLFSQAVVPAQ